MHSMFKGVLLSFAVSASFVEAAPFKVPVEKDASLIRESRCCSNPANTNFGQAMTVDIGAYHHASQGIFGLALARIPRHAVIKKAELILGTARITGSEPAPVRLGSYNDDWNEQTVTWNTTPTQIVPVGSHDLTSGVNKLDVTGVVVNAHEQNQSYLTFTFDAVGASNVFVAAKDDKQADATYLLLDLDFTSTVAASFPWAVKTHKDASVITRSMSSPDAATTNYGSAATVDAGSYRHQSSALFGFDLSRLPAGRPVSKAVLQFNASLVGSTPATFRLGHTAEGWLENTVVLANRPVSAELFSTDFVSGFNEIDVTAIIKEYRQNNRPNLTLTFDSTGVANAFIVSKEGDAAKAATLLVTFE